jgi:hypothetical protein
MKDRVVIQWKNASPPSWTGSAAHFVKWAIVHELEKHVPRKYISLKL